MVEQTVQERENEVRVTTEAKGVTVTAREFSATPMGKTSTSEPFTRSVFEGALDRVSRPVKGKYAHILPSSEDFIKDKRDEVELEERPS
jgi:hypothetical protein